MRRFFVKFAGEPEDQIVFDREETRHVQKVLRITAGEKIQIFDGNGNEFLCEVLGFDNKRASAGIVERIEAPAPESSLDLTIAIALIKGDKFDLVIQKAVELGVRSLVPITTIRCDVKLNNVAQKLERWQKIVIESSKQCGRATLMEISEPEDFRSFVESATGSKILFSERGGEAFSSLKADKKITAVVGPEGGWDDSEIEFALHNKFQIITLRGRILRAETAAISIASLLQNHFGDLN